jgi:hypothetical protein
VAATARWPVLGCDNRGGLLITSPSLQVVMSVSGSRERDWSGYSIIAVAIVWAAVILATSAVLEGTDYFSKLIPILGGGAAATLIILGGARKR